MYEVRPSDLYSVSIIQTSDCSTVCRTPVQTSHNIEDTKFEINPGAIVPAVTPSMIQHMTKEQVEELIRCNPEDGRFQFLPNAKGKSKVWRDFKILLFEGIPQDFARCNFCSAIVSYSNRTGTGALLRHKCSSFRNTYDNVMEKTTPFIPRRKSRAKRHITEDRKRWIAEKEAKFVISDLLPVNTVDSREFRSLAQALIEVGADYGKQNIDDVIASGQTLANTYMSELRGRIRNDIVEIMLSNTVSIACDLWTDGSGSRRYLTLTGHVVLDNFEMKCFVLGTRHLMCQTPEYIHSTAISILSEYLGDSLTEVKLQGTIVRQNTVDLVEAFQSYTALSCACHMLNSIVQNVLECTEEFSCTLSSAKRITAMLEQYHLNSILSGSFMNAYSNRWDTIYHMLKNLCEMQKELQGILSDRDETSWLEELDFKGFMDVVEFLDLFKECSESLSANSRPTLHEVVLWKMKIENHCKPNTGDSTLILSLKKAMRNQFHQWFSLHHLHYVALFLDPNFKKMKKLNEEERRTTIATIKGLLKLAADRNEYAIVPANSEISGERKRKPAPSEPSQKFRDFKDSSSEDEDADEITEVNHYISRKFGNVDDVLGFWKTNTEFPNLRQLVRKVLSIPACSASGEKLFCKHEQPLNEKRARLSGDHVDELLFLHHNLDY